MKALEIATLGFSGLCTFCMILGAMSDGLPGTILSLVGLGFGGSAWLSNRLQQGWTE